MESMNRPKTVFAALQSVLARMDIGVLQRIAAAVWLPKNVRLCLVRITIHRPVNVAELIVIAHYLIAIKL